MACTEFVPRTHGDIILSNYSLAEATQVQVGCRMFGRRLTAGSSYIKCATSKWTVLATNAEIKATDLKCEWTGTLNMYEKLIIGLGSAGGGLLILGLLLICILALTCKRKRSDESETESYPPSQINEKVGYAQYGNGGYNSGGGSGVKGYNSGGGNGIKGYRPSGNYEKQIVPDSRNDYPRSPDGLKRDPYLWSGYNVNQHTSRESDRPDTGTGYQFYSGKGPSSQYDNRAFDRNENDRYRETGYHGTNYQQGKREDYRWNGQLPRAHMGRDRQY